MAHVGTMDVKQLSIRTDLAVAAAWACCASVESAWIIRWSVRCRAAKAVCSGFVRTNYVYVASRSRSQSQASIDESVER